MTKEQERRWKEQERAAQAERKKLLDETHDDVISLLQRAKSEIALTLASQPSDYQQWRLSLLNLEVERLLGAFSEQSGEVISKAAGAAWAGGIAALDKPLAAAGIQMVLPVLDSTQLQAMRTFVIDRIKDVGVQAAQKIKSEIGLAMIGIQDIGQTINKVAGIMGETSKSRVTTIVGDNLSRAWATASHDRALQSSEYGVQMVKIWRRSGKIHSRLAHDLTDGVRKDIDQPFIINGHKLMYPKDPKAPIEESINCGCVCLYRPADMAGTLADKRPFTAQEIALNPNKAQTAIGRSVNQIIGEN
ncbi:hypothetical protein [Azonexus hydrophilus]|uniref:hypothetical protein n=1 Tax=Azonexus hydrophilus TaxID=418702 RepID=UPI00248FC7BC|nr:hypothetical protein [Azonexus hydrophilus]